MSDQKGIKKITAANKRTINQQIQRTIVHLCKNDLKQGIKILKILVWNIYLNSQLNKLRASLLVII